MNKSQLKKEFETAKKASRIAGMTANYGILTLTARFGESGLREIIEEDRGLLEDEAFLKEFLAVNPSGDDNYLFNLHSYLSGNKSSQFSRYLDENKEINRIAREEALLPSVVILTTILHTRNQLAAHGALNYDFLRSEWTRGMPDVNTAVDAFIKSYKKHRLFTKYRNIGR